MKTHKDIVVKNAPRWARFGAIVAAGALVLTACAGSGDATPPAAEESPAASAELGTLNVIQSITHDLTMGGVEVAQLKDLYPGGLEVEIATSTKVAQALATEDVDIGVSAPTRVLGAILQGLDVSIVGPTIDVWDQYIMVSKDVGATKIEDLKGLTFGTSSFGSASDYAIGKMAAKMGWTEDDYEVVTMGDIAGLVAGLQNKTIDVFLWGSFAPFKVEADGYADNLGSVQELIGPAPLDVIAVRNDVLKERPAAVKAFCEGVYAANKFMKGDPAATEKIFAEWGVDEAILPAALAAGLPVLSESSEITDEMLTNLIDATQFTVEGAEDLDLARMKEIYVPCDSL